MQNDILLPDKLKSIIESIFFVSEKPISVADIAKSLKIEKKEIQRAIDALSNHYKEQNSGICIVKVAGGYQMCSNPDNEVWVKKIFNEKSRHHLSPASLETLAIIAYKQPITKMEIEALRGVNVDGVVRHLYKMGLIKIAGKKEAVGRPFLYATTRKFLEHFGLNSLSDLPKLEEFTKLEDSLSSANVIS